MIVAIEIERANQYRCRHCGISTSLHLCNSQTGLNTPTRCAVHLNLYSDKAIPRDFSDAKCSGRCFIDCIVADTVVLEPSFAADAVRYTVPPDVARNPERFSAGSMDLPLCYANRADPWHIGDSARHSTFAFGRACKVARDNWYSHDHVASRILHLQFPDQSAWILGTLVQPMQGNDAMGGDSTFPTVRAAVMEEKTVQPPLIGAFENAH